jgi:hypothetical protein
VQVLLERGRAVSPRERYRFDSARGIRITTAALEPSEATRLAADLAELSSSGAETYPAGQGFPKGGISFSEAPATRNGGFRSFPAPPCAGRGRKEFVKFTRATCRVGSGAECLTKEPERPRGEDRRYSGSASGPSR